jgi:hypothetical protein
MAVIAVILAMVATIRVKTWIDTKWVRLAVKVMKNDWGSPSSASVTKKSADENARPQGYCKQPRESGADGSADRTSWSPISSRCCRGPPSFSDPRSTIYLRSHPSLGIICA